MRPEKQRKLLWAALTIVGVLAIVLIVYISQLITEMTKSKQTEEVTENFCNATQGFIDLPANGEIFFQSPNYNSAYARNKECVYRLRAPFGAKIEIDSVAFALESSTTSTCKHDSLTFSELGSGVAIGAGTFCGINGPKKLQSKTNNVKIVFRTDSTNQYHGFNVSVRVADRAKTSPASPTSDRNHITFGANLTVPENGEVCLSSPNYPNYYPRNIDLVWFIIGQPGQQIQIDSTHFDLESNSTCQFDSLRFFDMNNGTEAAIDKPFCGINGPKNLSSSAEIIKVVFHTDDGGQYTGFNISARVFRPSLMDILAVPSITEDGTNTNQSSNDISTGESSSTPAVQHTSERSNMTGNSSTEELDQELQNSNAGAAVTITTNTSVNTFADVTFSPTDASTQDLVNMSSTTESERADSPAPENVEEAGQQI